MAITQDYVSCVGVEGNDYSGASFIDGAYTSATKTLVKAGAFAATSVGHWLYLESNDGGSIVAGYYRVATVPDANTVTLATDAGAGVDDDAAKCTQHAGTALLPWRSLQGAFDLLTRNVNDGNQVNLKAGAANVNDAALDLDEVIAGSALGAARPLIVRGYTAAANDGGIGEIDCNGATMFAEATYDYIWLVDLEIHSGGDNNLVVLDSGGGAVRCEMHSGASSPSGKYLFTYGTAGCCLGCYVHDPGEGAARGIQAAATPGLCVGNYVDMGSSATGGYGIYSGEYTVVENNIVICRHTGQNGIAPWSGSTLVRHNVIYNTTAGTGRGIYNGNGGAGYGGPSAVMINNIICGWSGAGGDAIEMGNLGVVGYNAFYNNTNTYTVSDQTFVDLKANDVALAADPFTDAANGDFSLTAAGKTALRGLGWPGAYLGANAATDGHITIGPIQYGEAEAGGGGGPVIGSRIVRPL